MDKKKRLVMKKHRKNKARLKRKRQELAVKFIKTTDSPQAVEEKLVPEKEAKKAKPKAKPKAAPKAKIKARGKAAPRRPPDEDDDSSTESLHDETPLARSKPRPKAKHTARGPTYAPNDFLLSYAAKDKDKAFSFSKDKDSP